MNTLKSTLVSLFCLQLAACGPAPHEEAPPEPLAAQYSGLATPQVQVTALGCTFTLSGVPQPGTRMSLYDVVLERAAQGCLLGPSRRVLGRSYSPPVLRMVSNELGLAVAYTHTARPSGSAPTRLAVGHLLPVSLDIIRLVNLSAYNGSLPGHVHLDTLSLPVLRRLVVTGLKEGSFPGEVEPAEDFVATFEDFFTSLNPPVLGRL
jgi:hypothetical protein